MMNNLNYQPTSNPVRSLLGKWIGFVFCFLCVAVLGMTSEASAAPAKVVRGKVVDSDNRPVVGVSVLELNTTNGTTTDINGDYQLTVKGPEPVLQFSYIGYESQEVAVGTKTVINITFASDNVQLDDVVVVGYGTMRKKDVTGSIAKVNMDEKATFANTNVLQSLQGAIPGLNIGMTTGAGTEPEMTVRSTTSISASNNPLVVVDGAIYNGSVSDFAPSDIQSVDVLKDASSAAVYGSRAANGVIMITTRMGSTEKPTIRVNSYWGVNTSTNKPDMMDGPQYIQKILDYRRAQGLDYDRDKILSYLNEAERENYSKGHTMDSYDAVTDPGFVQNYSVSMSGRTRTTNYFASVNYNNQDGIVMGDDYDRFSARLNLETNITSWLKVGMKANYSESDYSGATADLIAANYMSPYVKLRDENGELIRFPMTDQLGINPLGEYEQAQDLDLHKSLFGIFYGEVSFPFLKGLKYKFNYSHNYRWSDVRKFWGTDTWTGAPSGGKGSIAKGDASDYIVDNIVSFDRNFGKHYVNVTLLYSYEHNEGSSVTAAASEFANSSLGWNALDKGAVQTVSSSAYDDNGISQMARLHYGYDNRYLVTFTIRRDGYSRFGADNKFGTFPSAALGWVASREAFLSDVKWIDLLKLRLSYGLNGNQAVSRYASLATINTSRYVDGPDPIITQYTSSMENASLCWESTKTANIGLDFAFLKSRISGSVDFFKSKSKDLIMQQSLPYMTGFGSVWANVGELKNHGVEVTLTTVNVQNENWNWTTTFNFSRYRNEITKLYGGKTEDITNSWFVGYPIHSFYGYETDGIWQEGDDIPEGFKPGYFRIKDLDGKEGITPDGDRHVYAYADPNYRVSISSNLTWKNLSLSFVINSVQGGNGYYMAENPYALNPNAYFPGRMNMVDMPYWTPDRPSNKYPTIDYSPTYGHYFLQDRSFVRLQDLSIAYDFPKRILNKIGMSGLRAYVSGKNLFTVTDWVGYDPEAGQSVFNGTPSMRSYILGIDITF